MLEIPDRRAVSNNLQAYSRSHLPEIDPTITRRRGFIGGLIKSLASGIHDWFATLKRFADYEPWPQTASENFLPNGWWVPITQLTRNPAAPARGRIVVTGVSGTVVDAGDEFTARSSTYVADASQVVVTQSLLLASVTRVGALVIVETVTERHDLATGQTVTIAGAVQADYNGAKVITVTAPNEFTFAIATSPATPATGTIYAQGTWGNVDVTCSATGPDGNLDQGELTASSPAVGLDVTALTTFGGLAGGADQEEIEAYRSRVVEALGTDFGMFSAAEIKIVAKQVPGVTRVWVREAELYVATPLDVYEGQVKIAFVRDGDANIFPSAIEVTAVKDHILDEIGPAHTAPEDIMVMSPDPVTVAFTFTALSPDTASMRRAIRASLEQFFRESVTYGESIDQDAYRCAIRDAWDSERRQGVRSFTLSTPTGTVAVSSNGLPVLGLITWPN